MTYNDIGVAFVIANYAMFAVALLRRMCQKIERVRQLDRDDRDALDRDG